MNTFRKRVRIVGLAVVLGLAASLASAAAVPKASGVTPASGFRKIAATPVGVRPARSIACTTAGTNCNTASARVAEKCGFQLTEQVEQAMLGDGTEDRVLVRVAVRG